MAEIYIRDIETIEHLRRQMPQNGLPTGAGYLRVSTPGQAEDNFSLETQQENIRRYIDRKYGVGKYNIIWLSDEGITGALSGNREGLKNSEFRDGITILENLCDAKLISFLAVLDLSRFFRDTLHYLEFCRYHLQPSKATIISVLDGLESEEGGEELSFLMNAIQAEQWRKKHSKRIKLAGDERRRDGYRLGGYPYGWESDDARTPRKERRASESKRIGMQQSKDAPTVRMMYELSLAGMNYRQIKLELEKLEIPSPRGRKQWGAGVISQILDNPAHCGYNKDGSSLIIAQHHDKRIIDRAMYDAYIALKEKRAKCLGYLKARSDHLLSEVAMCDECGKHISIRRKDATYMSRYVCSGDIQHGEHDTYSVAMDLLDQEVVRHIAKMASSKKLISTARDRINDILDEQELADEMLLQKRQMELDANSVERKELLIRLRRNQGLLGQGIAEILETVDEERKKIEHQISELKECAQRRLSRENCLREAIKLLRKFELWETMTIDMRRVLVYHAVEKLTLKPIGNYVEVHLKLIFGHDESFQIPIRGNGGRSATGLAAVSVAELTTAYYLLHGFSYNQIAEERSITIDTVYMQVDRIKKRAETDNLEKALQNVAQLVEQRKSELLIGKRRGPVVVTYTNADKHLLESLAENLSSGEIAKARSVSIHTVRKHREKLYAKLKVHNADDAVRKARNLGIVDITARRDYPTKRQLDVLIGLNNSPKQTDAANVLGITYAALKERLKCMYRKYEVSGIDKLLDLARERGWIENVDD